MAYVTAEQALKMLIPSTDGKMSGQEEAEDSISKTSQGELRKFISKASHQEQVMFVTAIASSLFVVKSGKQPSKREWTALEWLKENIKNDRNWDPLLQLALTHLFKKERGGIWHYDKDITTEDLTMRCLALDILVKVAALPAGSPLRGYCMLTASHLQGAVLTDADSLLQGVSGLGAYREYVCNCGFIYIIGNCTRPFQEGTCPQCHRRIGGTNHQLLPGNTFLRESGESLKPLPPFSFWILKR